MDPHAAANALMAASAATRRIVDFCVDDIGLPLEWSDESVIDFVLRSSGRTGEAHADQQRDGSVLIWGWVGGGDTTTKGRRKFRLRLLSRTVLLPRRRAAMSQLLTGK